MYLEGVGRWRTYSRMARSFLNIAAAQHTDSQGEPDDWHTIMDGFGLNYSLETRRNNYVDLLGDRATFSTFLKMWLNLASPSVSFEWPTSSNEDYPRLQIRTQLFGVLAFQLAGAVASHIGSVALQ